MTDIKEKNIEEINDSIFDKNGKHLLEDYRDKIKTKISIDFFDETVKAFIVYPKRKEIKKIDSETQQLLDAKRNLLILRTKFKISADCKFVFVKNQTFEIPTYYNAEMIRKEDEKTWQMIFYEIFKTEIQQALRNVNLNSNDLKTDV